jgi:hypothetical protein
LDYDDEKISFDAAMEALAAMGINALICTSPSHTAVAPRWRILVPTSAPCPPSMQGKLLSRLNGFMKARLGIDKVAAKESYTLSQPYYYGWVCNAPKPDHRAEVTTGSFIEQRDDLARYETLGAKTGGASNTTNNAESNAQHDQEQVRGFEAILSKIGDGDGLDGFNGPLSRATAAYIALHRGNPFDKDKLKALLREAINKAPKKPTRKPTDITRYLSDGYLDGVIVTAERKFVEERAITLRDFVAVMSSGHYLFRPTREMWPTKSVNACLPPVPVTKADGSPVLARKGKEEKKRPLMSAPTAWLDQHQRVEQISWAPGKPEIIKDRLIADGGWIERPGVSIFNLYRPPMIASDDLQNIDDADVEPWLDHLKTIYPNDWEHIVKWLAHRAQHPEEKINHCLLLGGLQGIGKDTILEPVKHAVGPWNFQEISPAAMLGRFNGFLRAVVLRINEARDLGEVNRFAFYEHLKIVTAAPPDVLRVDEKNLREHYIFNCCGVIMTTNYKTGGVYLPPDDRRTFVAWSNAEKEQFSEEYWKKLWGWYIEQDGIRKVVAFLRSYNLSSFNAKAPPPRTPAFFEIVASGVAPEEVELIDLIERMGNPDALTIPQLSEKASEESDLSDLAQWIDDRNNRKAIPHKLEQCGYVRTPNPDNKKQGIWTIKTWRLQPGRTEAEAVSQRQHVYAKASLPYADQVKAVRIMIKQVETAGDEAKKRAELAATARRYEFNRFG